MTDTRAEPTRRAVLLGASNLTRGLATVVETARSLWREPIDFLVASGGGRSYGLSTRLLGRGLCGIGQCGLWRELDDRPPLPTVALVTDIGNDVMYGATVPQILDWVESCLVRLRRHDGVRIVVTGLPVAQVTGLRPWQYYALRTVLFPRNRDDFARSADRTRALDEGVRRLTERFGATLVEPRAEWYGFDPIHVRRSRRAAAWRAIVSPWRSSADGDDAAIAEQRVSLRYAVRSRLWAPESRRWFGVERRRRQPSVVLADGTRVSLF